MSIEPTPAQQPTQSELLDAIDFELARVREENARPGWTRWAAISGLAYCLWLMFDVAEHERAPLTASWLLVIAGRLAFETAPMLARLVPSPILGRAGGRFMSGATMLGSSRDLLLIDLLLTIGGAFLALASGDAVAFATKVSGLAFFAFVALMVTTLLVLSFMRIPLPMSGFRMLHDNRTAWSVRVIAASGLGIPAAFGVFAALGYLQAAVETPHNATLHDWRLAGLILVASLLVRLIPAVRLPSPLIPTLEHLRRDIVLRRLSPSDAVRRFDTIVLGLGIGEVLQENVAAILEARRHSKEYMTRALTAFYRGFGLDGEGNPDATIPRPLVPVENLEESKRHLAAAKTENDRTIQLIEKYRRKTFLYVRLGAEENDVRALMARFETEVGAITEAITTISNQLTAKAQLAMETAATFDRKPKTGDSSPRATDNAAGDVSVAVSDGAAEPSAPTTEET